MLNYWEVTWNAGNAQDKISRGITVGARIAFVIDGEVADMATFDHTAVALLEYADGFAEDAEATAHMNGWHVVKLLKNGVPFESFTCTERMAAVLLSEPTMVRVIPEKHKHYQKLTPGWRYENDDFIMPGHYE